ncbi:MAG: aminotransferase class I/II-fold pyridoxal phosphate-dependent enzyme [Thermoanaerobaculia bacterium]|nr:aminotransferase class I/II-fold pyridoxal phosphate-dependent enzyme [Thermoanaerobaculia bacterium]
MALMAGRIAALGTENAFKLGTDIARVAARGVDVVKFNLGEPDFDSPPHINREAIRQIEAGNGHYCDPAGITPFREAISRHIELSRGLAVPPDRIVVTPGAKPPIGHTLMAYVDPGDEVIYPSPGFPIYESWVTFVGARPAPLQLSEAKGFAFSADDLAALITDKTKVIVLNSPSNPTGGVLSAESLAEIAAVIRERARPDVRVYSDEVYEHILFDGESFATIATQPGMEERTVMVSGHSKGFAMTGWRLGWAALPTPEEAAVFKQLNINILSCVPPFIQEAGREAYESAETPATVARMVRAFEERRDWVVPALNAIPGVTCQMPRGAFYVFPNVAGVCERLGVVEAFEALPADERRRASCPSAMLQMFLLYRYGVATMDRNSFGSIGADGQHYLRLSIATSLEQLRKGVGRMAEAAEDRAGFERFLEEERLWKGGRQ